MNQTQLDDFKSEMLKLYLFLNQMLKVWDFESYTIITVLIQNLAFNAKDAEGYSLSTEIQNIKDIVQTLRLMSEYEGKKNYVLNYVLQNIDIVLMSYDI